MNRLWNTLLRNPKSEIRLFLFHYAGGSSLSFFPWIPLLPKSVEVVALELPGRQFQSNESFITDIEELLPILLNETINLLDRPYLFFGHSLGGLIAYELAQKIQRSSTLNMPSNLLISGKLAPHLQQLPPLHNLSEKDFLNGLKRYADIQNQIFINKETKHIYLPIFRADFELFETYSYKEKGKLNCPLTVFGGDVDISVPHHTLTEWKEHTNHPLNVVVFRGGHFFIEKSRTSLINEIIKIISFLNGK